MDTAHGSEIEPGTTVWQSSMVTYLLIQDPFAAAGLKMDRWWWCNEIRFAGDRDGGGARPTAGARLQTGYGIEKRHGGYPVNKTRPYRNPLASKAQPRHVITLPIMIIYKNWNWFNCYLLFRLKPKIVLNDLLYSFMLFATVQILLYKWAYYLSYFIKNILNGMFESYLSCYLNYCYISN